MIFVIFPTNSRELLEKLKDIECTSPKLEKLRLSPLSTNIEKTSEVLRLEILNLQDENKRLMESVADLQKRVRHILQFSLHII